MWRNGSPIFTAISVIAVLAAIIVALGWAIQGSESPLLAYVAKDDGAFAWVKEREISTPIGVTIHELRLTSQRWKDILWRHTLLVAQPKTVTTDTALLVISGDSTESRGDDTIRLLAATVATQLQALTAVLFAVPNQPLFNGLSEDHLIAHTLVKVLETGDKEWACLLPMTKSAVRAMNAIQQFAEKELNLKVTGFVVTGASKRGWTTWLTAVADPQRVKGIAPMVYDNLNIPAQMRHQKEVFGTYSEQISEYVERGLTDLVVERLDKIQPIVQLIDPYFYRERLTMPKLIINGTNDRYWALDAANFYFDDLIGEKHILYVPNAGHGLEGGLDRVLRTLTAFFNHVAGRHSLPQLKWKWAVGEGAAVLSVTSQPTPQQVFVWTATSPTRDFRDAQWSSQTVAVTGSEPQFTYRLEPPEQGYRAAFAELVYTSGGRSFSLCTTVRIVGK